MSGLRITSVNSQNLRALDGDAQPIRDETDTRLDTKIEVLRVFCAANDHVVPTPDLRDAILKQGPGSVDLEAMSLALSELEFEVNATYVAALSLTKFPVLAQMSEDQFVIILGQDGGEVELYDTSSPNNRAKVALDQFEAFFTGHLLQVTKKPEVQKTDKKNSCRTQGNALVLERLYPLSSSIWGNCAGVLCVKPIGRGHRTLCFAGL